MWMISPSVGSLEFCRWPMMCVLWHPAIVPARSWTLRHSASAPGWSGSASVLLQASCFQYSWVPPTSLPHRLLLSKGHIFAHWKWSDKWIACVHAWNTLHMITIQVIFARLLTAVKSQLNTAAPAHKDLNANEALKTSVCGLHFERLRCGLHFEATLLSSSSLSELLHDWFISQDAEILYIYIYIVSKVTKTFSIFCKYQKNCEFVTLVILALNGDL